MKISQKSKILRYLMKGYKLTPMEGLNLFGSWRLGARIDELRDEGFPILTTMITKGGKRFAQYSLDHQESLGI